jgi:hypothetical protein
MWAGVQNVSRPMERCQEMSHWPPIMAEVTAKTEHQTYQGTRSTAERTDAAETDEIEVAVVDAMRSLCTFTIIALLESGGARKGGKAGLFCWKVMGHFALQGGQSRLKAGCGQNCPPHRPYPKLTHYLLENAVAGNYLRCAVDGG